MNSTQKTGYWLTTEIKRPGWHSYKKQCSECGTESLLEIVFQPYCHQCGAEMIRQNFEPLEDDDD